MNLDRLKIEMERPRKWFDAKHGDKSDIYIYDVVGSNLWDEGNKTSDLVKEIHQAKGDIAVHINSPGGDVFDGMAIADALRAHKGGEVTTIAEGMAASIASVIFATGKSRIMADGSMLMIHNAWTMAAGDYRRFEEISGRLKKVNDNLVSAYKSAGIESEKQIRDMMDAETFLNADEAVELGIATARRDDIKIAACVWDIAILGGAPDRFEAAQRAKNKRIAEKALRDVGYSASEAKRILSARETARDASEEAEIASELKSCIEKMQQ